MCIYSVKRSAYYFKRVRRDLKFSTILKCVRRKVDDIYIIANSFDLEKSKFFTLHSYKKNLMKYAI